MATIDEICNSVVTNLYKNIVKRLRLRHPPFCAEHLMDCHKVHYYAQMPKALNTMKREYLKISLKNSSYDNFMTELQDLCLSGTFTGVDTLTTLLEIVLSLNPHSFFGVENKLYVNEAAVTFKLFVKKFPPCWRSLHIHYAKFFNRPLKNEKLTQNRDLYSTSDSLIDILLELLEKNIKLSNEKEMRESELMDTEKRNFKFDDAAAVTTPKKFRNIKVSEETQMAEESFSELTTTPTENASDITSNETITNEFQWEKHEKTMQTFDSLTHAVRLERLFIALNLLLKVLEDDLTMWLLHNQQNFKNLFCSIEGPLVLQVFQLTKFLRTSIKIERLFRVFSIAVQHKMSIYRLEILERYISLVMNASVTADIVINKNDEIIYPIVGEATKQLIEKFFGIFKTANKKCINNYINTINMLRMSFVRYEFTHQFLQMFYFPKNNELTPKTIGLELLKKRYQKFEINTHLDDNSGNTDAHITRQKYLDLLLLALRDYCDYYGILELKQQLVVAENAKQQQQQQQPQPQLMTYKATKLCSSNEHKQTLSLKEFEKKLITSADEMNVKTLFLTKPLVSLNLEPLKVHIDIVNNYVEDLTVLNHIRENFPKFFKLTENVDLNEWQKFLDQLL